MVPHILLVCLQLVLTLSRSAGVEYYVTPTLLPNPNCPQGNHCHTLNQYAVNSSQFFDNVEDISLLFLDGIHNLTHRLEVRGTANFYMSRLVSLDNHLPVIAADSQSNSGLSFSGVFNVTFEYLSFTVQQSFPTANSLTQCVDLMNVKRFEGIGLLFAGCSLNTSYFLVNDERHLSREHGNKGNVMLFLIQNSNFLNANISIDSFSSTSESNTSVNATLLQTEIDSGGLCVNIQQVGFSLTFYNSNISNGIGIEFNLLSKAEGQKIAIDASIKNSIFTNNSYGIYVNTIESDLTCMYARPKGEHFNQGGNVVSISVVASFLANNSYGFMLEGTGSITSLDSIHVTFSSTSVLYSGLSGMSVITDTDLTVDLAYCVIQNNGKTGLYVSGKRYSNRQTTDISIANTVLSNNTYGLFVQINNVALYIVNSFAEYNNQIGIKVSVTNNDRIAMITYDNCKVTHNGQVGIYIQSDNNISVGISNSLLEHNYNMLGDLYRIDVSRMSSASAVVIACPVFKGSSVSVTSTVFKHNYDFNLENKAMLVFQCDTTFFEGNNLFESNIGTPIRIYNGELVVSGNLTLQNNTASHGGGMSFIYATLFLQNNTFIEFVSNYASDTGGGIYYPSIKEAKDAFCFYQIPIEIPRKVTTLNIEVAFGNNSAGNGGDDIFGVAINDVCYVNKASTISSSSVYLDIFTFRNESLSTISSEPTRVCHCDKYGVPKCAEKSFILSTLDHPIYPGESFRRSVTIVGKEFGTVSGSVYANLLKLHINSDLESLENSQYSQAVNFRECKHLEYTVYSKVPGKTILVLTATLIDVQMYATDAYVSSAIAEYTENNVTTDRILNLPVYINITIEECPPGFSLSEHPPFKCECDQLLTSNGIHHCTIENHIGMVYRTGTIWLSISNKSDGIIIHRFCPYGYCKAKNISIDPRNPVEQCALNRSGILCGECQNNFSLVLGSHRCISCPNNNYLALLIPIALGTVVLVILIKVLDLTVAKGTLNGLIFYVNIIWANESILFPVSETKDTLYYITHVFIAWLNLDFGIETCFIRDLDAYGKTWFHFGQDIFYIIIIATLIILFSRYSTLATKLLGNNSVPVLATMFFLSYAKLLQTIIDSLGFSILSYPNTTDIVWSLDGNVPYFGLKHSFLFVVALAAFFLLWLPYTIVLTFGQCLRRKSHFRILRWVDRQKPYFDAYFGPLKDRYHYWFGLLLLVRGVLLITLAITSTFSPLVNLLIIAMVGAGLLVHPYQYRNWFHSLLEKLFFLNLVILACGLLFAELLGTDKIPIVYSSVGVSLTLFVGIVLFHTFATIKRYCTCNKKSNSNINHHGYESLDRASRNERLEESHRFNNGENARLREPLLESSSVN